MMRHLVMIFLVAGACIPIGGSSFFPEKPVEFHPIPVDGSERIAVIDVILVAKVVWAESRGESEDGKIAVIDAIRNRVKTNLEEATKTGMASGKLDEEIVSIVSRTLREPVSHCYSYWYNPVTATDWLWLIKTEGWPGEMVGQHWFFREP